MAPLPDNGKQKRHHRDRKENYNEVAFKPILGLPAIENDFEAGEGHGHRENSPSIDLQLSVLACCFDFALERRRIRHYAAGQDQRNDAYRNVDEEYPSPAPMVRDPTAQRRPDRGCGDDGHAVESEGGSSLRSRKSIHEYGLLHRSQSASAHSLQDAEKNQGTQARSEAAQQRADGEECYANHVIALTSEEAAQPSGERQNDGIRDQVAG